MHTTHEPAMQSIHNARALCLRTVTSMATSDQPLHARLLDSYEECVTHFYNVSVPSAARADFVALGDAVSSSPAQGNKGRVAATLDAVSDAEVKPLAALTMTVVEGVLA